MKEISNIQAGSVLLWVTQRQGLNGNKLISLECKKISEKFIQLPSRGINIFKDLQSEYAKDRVILGFLSFIVCPLSRAEPFREDIAFQLQFTLKENSMRLQEKSIHTMN